VIGIHSHVSSSQICRAVLLLFFLRSPSKSASALPHAQLDKFKGSRRNLRAQHAVYSSLIFLSASTASCFHLSKHICMAGGERERKGKKRVESRFRDPKRPKGLQPSKAKSKALSLKKEGFLVKCDTGESFFFCPKDGQKLKGKLAKCSKCQVDWGRMYLSEAGHPENAHLVDLRDYLIFWRKKLYWRLTMTYHSGVKFSTDPPNPFTVFDTVFAKDFQEAAWKTSSGLRTHVRILETTRAVEDFCSFNLANEDRGLGAAKLFPSGEIVMVVPPVEVTHTKSPISGSKVHFVFGWVSMTAHGMINHAEHMKEPAEGWSHVNARVRDHAFNMLDVEMDVSYDMVLASEIILRTEYESDEAFLAAREERNERDAHFIMPRPEKAVEGFQGQANPLPFGEYFFPPSEENGGASGSGGLQSLGFSSSEIQIPKSMKSFNLAGLLDLFKSCFRPDSQVHCTCRYPPSACCPASTSASPSPASARSTSATTPPSPWPCSGPRPPSCRCRCTTPPSPCPRPPSCCCRCCCTWKCTAWHASLISCCNPHPSSSTLVTFP
jgi:hypothetical protein